ncbi:DUF4910 domain-containing protein [Bryobacter aggregatus]|uniref:DUF4910 domain-containing protein n=1 Tax=Bryobacter aggregatus TaxID=360054 RepID=UPI0004E1BF40|nr:DUF4910 domain-containing protein [Bryobacter aggregatus]
MPPFSRAAVLAVAVGGALLAQSSPLSTLSRTIFAAVNAERALETVVRVYANDRWFRFPKFQETAQYLQVRLDESGVQQLARGAAPADGHTQVGFWTMPLAWDVAHARLDLIGPERASLCDYQASPACLGMWSGATPAGGLDLELVDLETTDWKDVKGKLVLTHENSANLKSKLVQHGAAGALNGFSENPKLGDDRQWINAWGDYGWGFLKTSTPLLSFSATPRQVQHLQQLLAAGKVMVHADVSTRFYEGVYPWLTGLIPGTTEEEVLVLAHTAEQGAQDNATGVAASIEAMNTLQTLIASGTLPKPRRGIRILLMPEMYGSLHYIEAHRERMKRTIASITVDTPAASYELAGTEYTVYRAPHVGKAWTDALMPRIAKAVLPRQRPSHVAEHATGTDAYLSEPAIGVPNVWIYSGTGDVTHHNSADKPQTVDLRSMRDLVALVAEYLYYTASAGEKDVPWLANITLDAAMEDLRSVASRGLDAVGTGDARAASFSLSRLDYIADRNEDALRGLARLGASPAVLSPMLHKLKQFRDLQTSRLRDAGVHPYVRTANPAQFVVRRKRIGTIPLDDLAPEQREGFPSGAWDKVVTVALYWCDGKRTVGEAAYLTEMEMGRPLSFDFVSYFRFLERHGYVDIAN